MNRSEKIFLSIIFLSVSIRSQMIEVEHVENYGLNGCGIYIQIERDATGIPAFTVESYINTPKKWDTVFAAMPLYYNPYLREEKGYNFDLRSIFLNGSVVQRKSANFTHSRLTADLIFANYQRIGGEKDICPGPPPSEGILLTSTTKEGIFSPTVNYRPRTLNNLSQAKRESNGNWESLPPGPLRDTLEDNYPDPKVDRGVPWVYKIKDHINNFQIDCIDSVFSTALEIRSEDYLCKINKEFGSVLIKSFKITNTGPHPFEDLIINYYSSNYPDDSDILSVGSDPSLNLGYVTHGTAGADGFSSALGFLLLEDPENRQGVTINRFGIDHDAVNESNRYYISSSSFSLGSGEVEELVIAVFLIDNGHYDCFGANIKEKAEQIRNFFETGFSFDLFNRVRDDEEESSVSFQSSNPSFRILKAEPEIKTRKSIFNK